MKNKNITIVGFGRFGKVLYNILKSDFNVSLFSINDSDFKNYPLDTDTKIISKISDIYKSHMIFYAIPISKFEKVIKEHSKYINNHLLIDVLSVKVYPKQIFEKYIKTDNTEILLTHPMFGPDSIRLAGLTGQPIILDKFKSNTKSYKFWKEFFLSKNLNVIEMTAQKHDELAAASQGITHFIGRLLEEYKLKPTEIDSLGAKKLAEIMGQTCNDTWELFESLQNYNPYTKEMRMALGQAYDNLFNKLLSKQIDPNFITFGIQGGESSFNEEALLDYIKKNNIKKYKIKYLYTTEKVLKALYQGDIDKGIFAIQNSIGGIVDESIIAMANYKFKIVEEIKYAIQHYLSKRKDVDISDITTIMGHPQTLKQCKSTLDTKFPNLERKSGTGDMIDHTKVAEAVSNGQLSSNIAILGPKGMASKYNLDIIADNLQDATDNVTSFLLVERQ